MAINLRAAIQEIAHPILNQTQATSVADEIAANLDLAAARQHWPFNFPIVQTSPPEFLEIMAKEAFIFAMNDYGSWQTLFTALRQMELSWSVLWHGPQLAFKVLGANWNKQELTISQHIFNTTGLAHFADYSYNNNWGPSEATYRTDILVRVTRFGFECFKLN